ncbi:hypothetical protein P12x_000119 [Tundrisphaera lichenicola]|uniref:hypothetical protein n=1 Tax=Tundrisphaera lichenicola TaxID=2029860 RepID=UPI003EBB4A4E
MERRKHRVRPSIEGLEGRQLLNGSRGHAAQVRANSVATVTKTKIDYTTSDGAKVHIQLRGPGSLKGSTVTGDVLNLVFAHTTTASDIIGNVKGGSGQASLGTLRNENVPIGSLTGLGGNLIDQVKLPKFNLISGGIINLLDGANELTLNSVAPNSQVRLRDTPLNTTSIAARLGDVNNNNNSFNSSLTSIASITTSNLALRGAGTLEPVITGFGGPNVGASNGAFPSIPTIGNGQNFPGTLGLTQATVSAGRSLNYASDGSKGVVLSGIAGTFMPGPNLIEPRDASIPGDPVPPPGVLVNIKNIKGGPTVNSQPLGNAQIFGYDSVANALIRFDAVTGAQLQSIAVPASPNGQGGVTLAPINGHLLALVGLGQGVFAYDAVSGAPVGGFMTTSLVGLGINSVTGLTYGNETTVIADANSGPNGTLQTIDLAQSLATGQAVAVGSPFSPNREFALSGGITSVPGYPSLYSQGGAYFDTFQPNQTQAGVLTLNASGGAISEASRTALSSQGNFVPTNPDGSIIGDASRAVGSIDSFLAIDKGVQGGQNVIGLVTPNGLSSVGTIYLANANPLAGLSQSFHPELVNSALIDVQGNVQSFTAKTATGMVLNVAGNLNIVSINQATDSTIIGLPFGHVDIGTRNNVAILSSDRIVSGRGGVTVIPSARQVGPLFLP